MAHQKDLSFRDKDKDKKYKKLQKWYSLINAPRIKVKEGDVIGTVGPHSFDFQIMDTTKKSNDILSPQNIDPWTSVTVDSFDYVSESLKNELLQKNLRKNPPLGGRVGYDKEGTILGNWFKVGRG